MIRAPGSLFLFGEYAALIGASAIVSAVDRYVSIESNVEQKKYSVTGLPDDDLVLPHAVCDALELSHDLLDSLHVDVSSLYEQDQKLGLSSSAASVVALVRALGSDNVEQDAFRAHSLFQKKSGSGADIKIAVRGGTWGVVTAECHAPFRREFSADEARVQIPEGLEVRAVWLGAPASTTSMVGAVAKTIDSDPEVKELLMELGKLSHDCIENQNPSFWIASANRADLLLERLGNICGSPIVVEAHQKLRGQITEPFAVKPSGAGGGDFSLVFGPKNADWNALDIDFYDLTFDAPM